MPAGGARHQRGAKVEAGDPLTLTLALDPAGGPLTYGWSDQISPTATMTYTWNTPGVYTVTASATNWCKAVSTTVTVTVTPMPPPALRIFLPFISQGVGGGRRRWLGPICCLPALTTTRSGAA